MAEAQTQNYLITGGRSWYRTKWAFDSSFTGCPRSLRVYASNLADVQGFEPWRLSLAGYSLAS